jgi:hypothetical protein
MYHIDEITNPDARERQRSRLLSAVRPSEAATYAVRTAAQRGWALEDEDVFNVLDTATAVAERRGESLGKRHVEYAMSFCLNI